MEKLYEVALSLYQKITTTDDWTFEDYTLFVNIYNMLNNAGYAYIRKLNDIVKPNSKYSCKVKSEIITKYNEGEKVFRQFYSDIGANVIEIFSQYFDNNNMLIDFSDTITLDKAKKIINKYYRKADPKYADSIKDTLFSDRIFLSTISKYIIVKDEGSSITLDDKQYITAVNRSDDLIDISTVITLVHELGHSIGLKKSTIDVEIAYSPFRELISKTHEFAFCKKHSKESNDYKLNMSYSLINLRTGTCDLYDDTKVAIYPSIPYTLGIYIGLYLSHLYMTDRNKFKHLYNEIKKYIFTSEESKIFDLLLQEKEIKTGEFLKREIEENQKILIKK